MKEQIEKFIQSSNYTRPVEIKKLEFIFSSIDQFVKFNCISLKDLRILEIGCGNGGITFPLASLGCSEVKAIDIDDRSINELREKITRESIMNLNVYLEDGYTFDDGEYYDVIIASEVFEHVCDPKIFANNILKRMSKQRSLLIVTVPNGYGPWELRNHIILYHQIVKWNWLRHLLGKRDYYPGSSHCRFFTKSDVINLFAHYQNRIINFGKSDSFFAIFPPFTRGVFGKLDIELADVLPFWLVSGFYFAFEFNLCNSGLPGHF